MDALANLAIPRAILAVTAVALLASCTAGPPTATPSASPAPTATPAPSTPTPAPSTATPAPTDTAAQPTATVAPADGMSLPETGDVPAGTYVSDSLGPTITFTVGEGLVTTGDTPEVGFDLIRQYDAPAGLSVIGFGGEYFADACDPESETVRTPVVSAEAFMDFLTARDGVIVDDGPSPTTVGGFDGSLVDLHTELPDACGAEPPEWILLWTIPVYGDFHFADDETARVIALDVDGQVVVIVIEAYPGADYEEFLAEATAIVASMEIRTDP